MRVLDLGRVPYGKQTRKASRNDGSIKKGDVLLESIQVAPEYASNVALEFVA